MEYFRDDLDRRTGDLVRRSLGDWITITELGKLYGAGNKRTRAVLRQLDFVRVEGAGKSARHRLAPWVTERGWGKRLHPQGKFPFDVVGPEAQAWIAGRWSEAVERLEDLSSTVKRARDRLREFLLHRPDVAASTQGQQAWLNDNFPSLTQSEKAAILDVSQQLVSRFDRLRAERLRALAQLRRSHDGPVTFPITSQLGVSRHITQVYNTAEK